MKKLHLGCGKRHIPGFIHIDLMPGDHIDHQSSVDDLTRFKDGEVDLIYASHLLEHFPRNQTDGVLKEWYRVLKPSGILRVAVPDFEKLIEVYQKYHDLSLILGPLMGGQDYQYNFHGMAFDFPTLAAKLKLVGFSKVVRYDWRKTEHKDVDDFSQAYIPHMDKKNGILISLNVEATK